MDNLDKIETSAVDKMLSKAEDHQETLNCQTFDDDYETKPKVGCYDAYSIWLENTYHPKNNPTGIVNFAVSVNSIIPKTTIKYLPNYLTPKDCAYPDPHGYD